MLVSINIYVRYENHFCSIKFYVFQEFGIFLINNEFKRKSMYSGINAHIWIPLKSAILNQRFAKETYTRTILIFMKKVAGVLNINGHNEILSVLA